MSLPKPGAGAASPPSFEAAVTAAIAAFDERYAGSGSSPKEFGRFMFAAGVIHANHCTQYEQRRVCKECSLDGGKHEPWCSIAEGVSSTQAALERAACAAGGGS